MVLHISVSTGPVKVLASELQSLPALMAGSTKS